MQNSKRKFRTNRSWIAGASILLFLLVAPCIPPAMAQQDPTGDWVQKLFEDEPERGPGPEIGDYLGLPINASARLRGDTWDATLIELPENQCRPHSSDYEWRSPSALRVWKEVDRSTQQIIAYHTHMFFWAVRIVAGAARRPALFPQLFPIPDPGRHLVRQRESELMREHTHLPAMVGFVRKHVAQHFQANRPRPSPAVSAKLLDAAPTPPSASASISAQRAALSANPARACCGVQCARLSCGGTFRCGAVSLTHLERTLCMCVKIAAMVRALPGGLALQAAGSRCSIRTWFMRSLAAKIWTAARPS
jgi:hypothetical protein